MPVLKWSLNRTDDAPPRTFVCGYCGRTVGPNRAYTAEYQAKTQVGTMTKRVYIYICSNCRQPTYFDPAGRQWPGVAFGAEVDGLPDDVGAIYAEARRCMSVSAYNTAVMACRKLLMHVAAERGAEPGKNFKYYVDWLVEHHYVPPGGEGWADQIRGRGNEANHEIDLIDQASAEQVLSFTEFLLKFVYELPARAGLPVASP